MKNHWLNKKVRIVDIRTWSSQGVNPIWCPENVGIELSNGHIYQLWISDEDCLSSRCLESDGAGINERFSEWDMVKERARIIFADRLKAIKGKL